MMSIVKTLGALAVIVLFATHAHAVADRELVAKADAETWIALVDAGKFAEAYNEASPTLKSGIRPKDWANGLIQVRQPFGEVRSRKLLRLFATNVLPGDIEGDFVVVNFSTKYANREQPANEILVMEAAGGTSGGETRWLVAGFYIE